MLLIGTKNTTPQTLLSGAIANLGTVYRRFCKKNACGVKTFDTTANAISLQQTGVYKVTVTATFSAPAAGVVTLQLFENGTAIPGASASQTITTATTELRSVAIDHYILVDSSCVCGIDSILTKAIGVVNTGVSATITNLVVDVLKVL